ncbi:MAG: diacylglyceryl transferase [Leptolyngbya sp. SIO4C1]|nr:diacylglyceryl transferase [Leptolyngbya sp. SIO4C1]
MAINTPKIQMVLQGLVSGTAELEGAALVTPDGLPLVTTLPASMDEERVAAMSAAMLSLGERIGEELSRGGVARISVEGEHGHCVLTNCGPDSVLMVLANHTVKQGILSLAIKQTAAELKLILI